MAYSKFKPTVWSENIQRQLEGHLVLKQDCDFGYDGDAKRGEKVKILGIGRPTVGDYTGDDIGAPETVDGTAMFLEIDQAKFFNFMIDDVDRAQAINGLMESLVKESAAALATEADSHIAKVIYEEAIDTTTDNATPSTKIATAEAAKKMVDKAFERLWANGVQTNDTITITISPWFYNLFKDRLTELASNNVDLIRQGAIGMYNNALVRLSNNLHNDGTDDFMIVRTNNAIAYAGQIDETEAYRPEGLFADAVKGLYTYGAKVVRPKEMVVLRAHK
ncbi:MAG: hypothetical protein FWE04_02470 [Oscillospiraceae bacterium]|nr:hypothetical protein [Oscillospiraceae bacterium]